MKQKKCIGRIVYSSPAARECYYLRMLLNVVRGAQSFTKLMTVNKQTYATFKAACFAYDLLNDDKEWSHAIAEAKLWAMGPQLWDLFVTILLFCDVGRLLQLWEENWTALSKDILHKKGIASLLLLGSRRAHNRFVIPLELVENSTCGINRHRRPTSSVPGRVFKHAEFLRNAPTCPLLEEGTPRDAHTKSESSLGPMQ
ncbi:hypothetical protein Tco_1273613 [Tanacetum coccineum]